MNFHKVGDDYKWIVSTELANRVAPIIDWFLICQGRGHRAVGINTSWSLFSTNQPSAFHNCHWSWCQRRVPRRLSPVHQFPQEMSLSFTGWGKRGANHSEHFTTFHSWYHWIHLIEEEIEALNGHKLAWGHMARRWHQIHPYFYFFNSTQLNLSKT